MIKNTFIFLCILGVIGLVLFVSGSNKKEKERKNRITVITSFYPLYEFANAVGGEQIDVVNLVPAGSEPHEFEPTSQQIASLYLAHIFLFNGSGLDPWAEKIQEELIKKGVAVVHMSKHIDLLKNDPHFWLDPVLAQQEVEVIRDTLIQIDSSNEKNYRDNANVYLAKLSELNKKYKDGFIACQKQEIITSHAAFGYLAKRYDFTVISISGLSPEEEPSPKRMGEIATLAREKQIQYIFFETLVNPKLSETIAHEIGAQTLVFNPIEGLTEEDIHSGKDYISIMEDNLTNLKLARSCQ